MSTSTQEKVKPSHKDTSALLNGFDSLPDSGMVRLPVVKALYGGISSPTVWRWVKTGRLPKPHALGPNVTAWRVGELRAKMAPIPTEADPK